MLWWNRLSRSGEIFFSKVVNIFSLFSYSLPKWARYFNAEVLTSDAITPIWGSSSVSKRIFIQGLENCNDLENEFIQFDSISRSYLFVPYKPDFKIEALTTKCAFIYIILFFGGFVWGFTSHSRIFHSYGDVTITGEGLQSLKYVRHPWSLYSEVSLACHTYCDTSQPFLMVSSEDPWHSHLLPSVWQWSCHYLF